MSRTLTQPEEIDLALITIQINDSEPGTPAPEKAQPSEVMLDGRPDKSPQGSAEPMPYVWSM